MHHVEIVSQLGPAHLEQLPRLIDSATRTDGHEPLGEHKFLRLQHGEDLGAAVLAFEGERLVGYGHTLAFGHGDDRRVSCEIVVDPAYRRRGVGRMLLSHAIIYAHEQSARRIDLWAYNDSATSARIAANFGFEPERWLRHLHRHVGEMPAPPAIDEVHVRAFRPGRDESDWLALNNRIFAGHPENGAWTLDDLRARMRQPWFDPQDLLMLEVDGSLAGFCWLKVEERTGEGRVGEIYVIGTAPDYQGRGLGRYLVARALARLDEREAAVAAVYVDESNAGALRLYESAGFHHHHVDVCYTRYLEAKQQTRERAA